MPDTARAEPSCADPARTEPALSADDARAETPADGALQATAHPAGAPCPPMPPSPVARAMMGVVQGYRLLLKPWLGNACRFEPTCSAYALQAIGTHGALAGGALAAGRILRCHPLCAGGCDPVPTQAPRLFSRLLSPKSECP